MVAALVLATPTQAHAISTDWVDGIVGASCAVVGGLMMLVPVDKTSRWESELLPIDDDVRSQFSQNAAHVSDVLAITSVVLPVGFAAGPGIDERFGRWLLQYGETMLIGFALNAATKYLVQRPRPYVYNDHSEVKAYAAAKGDGSHLSFYSGHTALSFSGAVAGSYLFASSSDDVPARATLWGAEMLMASMTAMLRVRAGQHFYSDVIVGALVGIGVGLAVPALHEGGTDYRPDLAEWLAAGGGLVAGTALGLLLPFDADVRLPIAVAPLHVDGGSGVAVVGAF